MYAMKTSLEQKYEYLCPLMNEVLRRRWAACEALALGRGGVSAIAAATGLSRNTIRKGIAELQERMPEVIDAAESGRIRRPGGGRHALAQDDPALLSALQELLEANTRGDPMSPLLWTSKSTRKLAAELTRQGHSVSHMTVSRLLEDLDYSLQGNRKAKEGRSNPDRDAQFEYINRKVRSFQRRGQPVISIDTKKKELIGDFRNGGREWRPQGDPERVRVHDFRDKKLGIAIPYGVYDMGRNEGWVSVGIDHDTAEFAGATIRSWWRKMGSPVYPHAADLLITADGGGSNSSRSRLWKVCVQELADHLRLRITICHFPPGTSKWNKIEHRMFCHITENWRGRPLVSRAVVVNLIGNATTTKGLRIRAELDENDYPNGLKVTDDQLAAINIKRDSFHGEWNYCIRPR
jgi:transposase